MPSQRLKSLELALAKLIDAVHHIEAVDGMKTLYAVAAAAEKLLHKP